jgi:hypothetical protein
MLLPGDAFAITTDLKIFGGAEHGFLRFSDLAVYTGYVDTGPERLDVPRYYRYGLRDEAVQGFRVGVRVRDQFELSWHHLTAHSRYQAWIDGVQLVEDPLDPFTKLPVVDMSFDLIGVGWRIAELERARIAPHLRLGFGWVLSSQEGEFQVLARPRDNFSDSDKTIEFSGGLDWRWRHYEVGAEIRTFHWRFDTDDPAVPSRITHAWMWSLRAGVNF